MVNPSIDDEERAFREQYVRQNVENVDEPYTTQVLDETFLVYPSVFSPEHYEDTEFFAENVYPSANERFMEIGAGTGAISIFALKRKAEQVTATDINAQAIQNIRANARLHGVEKRIEVIESDVYRNVPDDREYDSIFWNTPWGLIPDEKISIAERGLWDPGYEATERFIANSDDYLSSDGRLLIGFSPTIGKFPLLQEMLEQNDMDYTIIAEKDTDGPHYGDEECFLLEARK